MSRRRIEASEIFSLPESASLDTLTRSYPGSVEASLLDQDGDLYLRIASGKPEDPEGMTKEDIQEKIKEWRTYAKENATNAGFRKANKSRGPMDPRRFALQLAEAARLNANRYRSPSLLRLAKKLKWVAGQERGVAARALAKMAAPLEEEARRRDQVGLPFIQKPPEQDIPPPSKFNEKSQLTPGEQIDYSQDQSWRARESGRIAKEKEVDSELVTMARDFLQDYKSRNSLYDEDLLDQLQDPNVFESWLLDLDSKGVNPDSTQLDEAWNEAMNEIAEGSGESLTEELEGGDIAPASEGKDMAPISATRKQETIQEYTAPGGDWFNTVINMRENPVMDRYLRTMKDKREGRSRVSRKIEVEEEIAEAVDQCLDHFAGDMLPGEISSDHVRTFIEDEFPEIDWEEVYKAIQDISDHGKRHEDEPSKERTNQEASRREASLRKADINPDWDPLINKDLKDKRRNRQPAPQPREEESPAAFEPYSDWTPEVEKLREEEERESEGGFSSGIDMDEFSKNLKPILEKELTHGTSLWEMFDIARNYVGHWSDYEKLTEQGITELFLVMEITEERMQREFMNLPQTDARWREYKRIESIVRNCFSLASRLFDLFDEPEHPEGESQFQEIWNIFDHNIRTIMSSPVIQQTKGRGPQASRTSGLKRYREICACCKGTGEKGDRCCGQCRGSGQTGVSAFDEDLDRKEKISSKLGTLLMVSVDAGNRSVSAADRQELARVTRTRVASKGVLLVLKHSTGLMKVLVENGIPYRTANYQHSRYKR